MDQPAPPSGGAAVPSLVDAQGGPSAGLSAFIRAKLVAGGRASGITPSVGAISSQAQLATVPFPSNNYPQSLRFFAAQAVCAVVQNLPAGIGKRGERKESRGLPTGLDGMPAPCPIGCATKCYY